MPNTGEIITHLERFAPISLADEDDNVGLLLGTREREVKKIMVSLNADSAAVDEAIEKGVDMLICHHPLIFLPIRGIAADDFVGRNLLRLAEAKIALYAMHTNLDWADGGVNDCLCEALCLSNVRALVMGPNGAKVARIGNVPALSLSTMVERVRGAINPAAKYVGKPDKIINTVAVCGGGGGSLLDDVLKNHCDLYISSDFRYHEAQKAHEEGVALIDAGHFETENIIIKPLANYVKMVYNSIDVFSAECSGKYWVYE